MGLNRNLLMGQSVDLKNIKAMMTVGYSSGLNIYGFYKSAGFISPNPLPNGITIEEFGVSYYSTSHSSARYRWKVSPSSLSFTINGVRYNTSGIPPASLYNYLAANLDKTIPVIFHFD